METGEIYRGRGYAFDSAYGIAEDYGNSFLGMDYRIPPSNIGFPSDPTTANQLQKVSEKISSGTRTIEVAGESITGGGPMSLMDKMPKQFFNEINRLRKLVGVDLTFHGPLVEPTGAKQGWKEDDRLSVERQMKSAVRRSHDLDPKGNLVVTFHSSNGLPEPETKIINEKGDEVRTEFWVINEDQGRFENVAAEVNQLAKEKAVNPQKMIEKRNEDAWFSQLQSINFNANQGADHIENALSTIAEDRRRRIPLPEEEREALLSHYKSVVKGEKQMEEIKKLEPFIQPKVEELTQGDIYLRSVYGSFQNLFNTAYNYAEEHNKKEDLEKLNKFRDEIGPKLQDLENNPHILAEELIKGVNVLRSVQAPQTIRLMREWAIDKAGTTFANVAYDAYKEFKDSAPIISIENPPAGSGLSRAEDLRDLVKASRKKFEDMAVEKGMSRSEAERQSKKLLGVTWDVGHINMIKGHGYEDKHLVKQTEMIAPYVKHVHLSDNFGLEHTELPMGMGNVPTKKMLDIIHKYNSQVKKIAETGDWFSRQGGLGLTQTPFRQTMEAFGSPVYGKGTPYWNQVAGRMGSYSSGQGAINPPIHHSIYGAGFTTLPVELGGQMSGQSRVSGAPIE